MSIIVDKYIFEGPYTSTDRLHDRPGVYVIICRSYSKNDVIDVGESTKIKTRIETHDRKEIWSRKCSIGTITVAVYYTPNLKKSSRIEIEKEIRNRYQLPNANH